VYIVLGFMLSSALYFVKVVLHLIVVCLTIILCASIFAFRPMLVIFSIHCVYSIRFVGSGGIFKLFKGKCQILFKILIPPLHFVYNLALL
jgi:hypothetical protein